MQGTRFWRNFFIALALAGALAGVTAYVQTEEAIGVDARIGLMVLAMFAIPIGVVSALVQQSKLRLRRKLASGEDVLARWRVDTDTWQTFVTVDAERQAVADMPANELAFPDVVSAAGVDVIVGRGAVQVGNSLHRVPERGAPEVLSARLMDGLKLSYVELLLQYPPDKFGDPPTRTVLRFPIADGSLRAAKEAVRHFARETPGRPDFFHGKGDGSDPEDLSKCWSCGLETYVFRSTCPRCGASLQSKRWSRRFGALLVVLGGALTAGLGWLILVLGPILRHPGEDIGGTRFDGTPSQAMMVLGILSVVLMFGLATLGYGIFQVITGRRSKLVVRFMLALALLLGLSAFLIH